MRHVSLEVGWQKRRPVTLRPTTKVAGIVLHMLTLFMFILEQSGGFDFLAPSQKLLCISRLTDDGGKGRIPHEPHQWLEVRVDFE